MFDRELTQKKLSKVAGITEQNLIDLTHYLAEGLFEYSKDGGPKNEKLFLHQDEYIIKDG